MLILANRNSAERDEKHAGKGESFIRSAVETLKLAYKIYRSEPISIRMFGDDQIRSTHRDFTSGHRLIPWVAKKSFGAALIDLSDDLTLNLTGRHFQLCRRKIRKASSRAYHFRTIDPLDHVEEILKINTSSGFRQGRPIARSYLDRNQVFRIASQETPCFGVFDRNFVLRAYTNAPILGDVFVFSRILGDAAYLDDGIMYLLVHRTLLSMRERYEQDGVPRWALYDMFLGATPGLRQFKYMLGFKPCRVQWEWTDHGGGREC